MTEPAPILVLATRNRGKVTEIKDLLGALGVRIRSLEDYPELGEIEEDGRTFAENAVKKAAAVALAVGALALADDSGLEVEALDGRPGIFSNRYAPTTDERNARLLAELQGVEAQHRAARFVCVAALADPQGHAVTRTGLCEGRIANQPAGKGGFGYDPIFLLPDRNLTLAQLTREEKNAISHRGRAFRAIREVLRRVLDEYGGSVPVPEP